MEAPPASQLLMLVEVEVEVVLCLVLSISTGTKTLVQVPSLGFTSLISEPEEQDLVAFKRLHPMEDLLVPQQSCTPTTQTSLV